MADPAGPSRISVVVVSRGRPAALSLCLTGCAQLYHPRFELVVVADPPGQAAARALPFSDRLRVVPFDAANISAARNAGLRAAGGDAVAFIDDDAVPEPTWLDRLDAALCGAGPGAVAATGAVRGRNGIGLQSATPWIDASGATRDPGLAAGAVPAPDAPPPPGATVKLVGTNMLIRRETLSALGGFDERYRFFLEDADIALRLSAAGGRLVHAPDAQVHHAFAASPRRRADRAPLRSDDIGRSAAIFLDSHGGDGGAPAALARFRAEERARLVRHLIAGSCEPRDLRRVLGTFDTGVAEAADAGPFRPARFAAAPEFRPFRAAPARREHAILAGPRRHRRAILAAAAEAAGSGAVVSAFVLSRDARYHRVRFVEPGIWLQSGGIFGRSVRDQPLFRASGLARRVWEECARISAFREPENAITMTQIRWIPGF